jgi:hypothetical protein
MVVVTSIGNLNNVQPFDDCFIGVINIEMVESMRDMVMSKTDTRERVSESS